MRVLLIEDDTETAEFVGKGLSESGHSVDHAADGPEGLYKAGRGSYDVLIVDRMLPGLDGLSIIEALRKSGNTTPTLILSAKDRVPDRVAGLRSGADDYLTKPFAFAELLARLEALTRRVGPPDETTTLRVADLEMNLLTREVRRAGREIELQPREFRILEYMMRNAGYVLTRTMLLENVWDYSFTPQTNVIEVHISRLRQKIDRGFDRTLVHTVRGAGYRLASDE